MIEFTLADIGNEEEVKFRKPLGMCLVGVFVIGCCSDGATGRALA